MDCRGCEHLKRFHRMSGDNPYCVCGHEKVDKLPVELFGPQRRGFICRADNNGHPRNKTHPRWCPLRAGKAKKGRYVAEWDDSKGKIALKYKEDKDEASTAGNQFD